MNAVILFSHGSLLCGAGEALQAHAARLQMQGIAPLVEVGYLNYSDPPFLQTVARCVHAGADRILVAPYFLVPGKFVSTDLPQAIAEAQAQFPNVTFTVAQALGYDELLADALIESARSAAPFEFWRNDLRRAAASCRADPQCPLYETPYCSRGSQTYPPTPSLKGRGDSLPAASSPFRSDSGLQGEQQAGSGTPPSQRGTSDSGKGAGGLGQNALLVMVHGSPRPTANAEMFRVVDAVRQRGIFSIVEVGFLECNAPSIPEAVAGCVTQGAERILAVPYFLHTGKHVADDLPTLLEAARERYPNVEFRLGEYLGRSERLTELLAKRIRASS